jgi:hypothetical protein
MTVLAMVQDRTQQPVFGAWQAEGTQLNDRQDEPESRLVLQPTQKRLGLTANSVTCCQHQGPAKLEVAGDRIDQPGLRKLVRLGQEFLEPGRLRVQLTTASTRLRDSGPWICAGWSAGSSLVFGERRG